MSGIKFNLKKKTNGGGINKPKISISLGKGVKKLNGGPSSPHLNNPLQTKRINGGGAFGIKDDEGDDEEGKVIQIDSFDSDTIKSHTDGGKHQEPLIIKPIALSKRLNGDDLDKERDEQLRRQEQESHKNRLKYGITDFDKQILSEQDDNDEIRIFQAKYDDLPDEDSEEEYAKVPVEQFGEALLRGMGWTGEDEDDSKDNETLNQQRGPVLGIGAKPIDAKLYDDINGGSNSKLQAPLIRRDKFTKEIIPDE
ncbi:DExH-box splicing factor binding site-domain-containing protein [Scheffersomyces coipomensis]|uniref:DExH-box splicing factor binding site-domain-containing protein n=1 Tax=Scheffersomyces coipomensis TaxID=1788519 RepID=UPI00315D6130